MYSVVVFVETGKWWSVNALEDIRGRVVLETIHDGRYVMALVS